MEPNSKAASVSSLDVDARQSAPQRWLEGPRRGIAIAVTGCLMATPDAMLIEWAERMGATRLAVLFWKLLFLGVCLAAYAVTQTSGLKDAVLKEPRLMATLAALMGLTSLGIGVALLLTYAANALLAYSLDPLWGAMLGWILLGDVLPIQTIAALCGAACALVLMFLPAILQQDGKTVASLVGDLAALAAGFTVALYITAVRNALVTGRRVSPIGASALGNLAAALGAALVAWITGATLKAPGPLFFVYAVLDGVAVSGVIVGFALAPRYIAGAHIGLISLVETILGPLWVFLTFGEQPPVYTLAGGTIVIVVVVCHESHAMASLDEPPVGDTIVIGRASSPQPRAACHAG